MTDNYVHDDDNLNFELTEKGKALMDCLLYFETMAERSQLTPGELINDVFLAAWDACERSHGIDYDTSLPPLGIAG